MFRLFFKLIVLLVLAALIYGLWLGYQEKAPAEKQEFNGKIAQTFQGVSRLLGDAARRVVEKGRQLLVEKEGGGRDADNSDPD